MSIQQMKLLLLILSLMTGCELLSGGGGCKDKWHKFICNHKTNGRFQMTYVVNDPKKAQINPGKLMVKLKSEDSGGRRRWNQCDKEEQEFEVDKNGCPKPFYQTAHTTAKTTVTCDYGDKCKHRFFCKEENSICENILSSASNRRFKFTETSRAVNISISHVSSQDAGVYWCGGESANNTFILRQIHVEVKGGSEAIIGGAVGAAVLLLFVIILILIYKRKAVAGEHVNEGCASETEEHRQNPNLEKAVNSIPGSAIHPSQHAASPHYATINFQASSDRAGGGTLQPSSSACEYSLIKFSKCPTNLTVTQPHRLK